MSDDSNHKPQLFYNPHEVSVEQILEDYFNVTGRKGDSISFQDWVGDWDQYISEYNLSEEQELMTDAVRQMRSERAYSGSSPFAAGSSFGPAAKLGAETQHKQNLLSISANRSVKALQKSWNDQVTRQIANIAGLGAFDEPEGTGNMDWWDKFLALDWWFGKGSLWNDLTSSYWWFGQDSLWNDLTSSDWWLGEDSIWGMIWE